jgi:tungstate transport system substrate-binding protein
VIRLRHSLVLLLSLSILLPGCAASTTSEPRVLRLATTTSTYDSGLLDAILPDFERRYGVRVDVIAVGTGQALAIAARGDADVVLVHARQREEEFVAQGHAVARYDVMYNDFVIVGPRDDPAGIQGMPSAAQALARIAEARVPFASRGDESGTHTKERSLWEKAGLSPGPDDGWYFALGQGMGDTLVFANERGAYTLTDRGTFLAMGERLPKLTILVGGASVADNPDADLYNPYGVMAVNPEAHPGVRFELAQKFVAWLTSVPVQQKIAAYGRERFGQPLFYPNSEAYRQQVGGKQ